MERRVATNLSGFVEEVSLDSKVSEPDALEIEPAVTYNTVEQSVVDVVCKFPANVSVRGQSSGKLYTWSGAGAVVSVDAVDVGEILLKKIGEASCCGGSDQRGNLVFERI